MTWAMEGILRLHNRWEETEMLCREDSCEEERLFGLGLKEMSDPAKKGGEILQTEGKLSAKAAERKELDR